MSYKVCLVEDEVVTRNGIRDNVNWQAHGFEFCGEATDGEMALPLLRTVKPDVLITDIKMPFMDGLQLCKIVRESMPWMKVVILSGHDEFEYAQAAIQLGVSEYLLKPVTVQDLHKVLQKIAQQLGQEKAEQESLQNLRAQVEENQTVLRERLLLKLVVGAISPTEVVEKSQLLGLDLIARYYLVIIMKVELGDRSEQFDYQEYQLVQQIVAELTANNPDIYLIKKDWEELVLLMKGNTLEYLEEERDHIMELLKHEIGKTRYHPIFGAGSSQTRITDIYQSFVDALVQIQNTTNEVKPGAPTTTARTDLVKLDRAAVDCFLRSGAKEDFDDFYNTYVGNLSEAALRSYLIKNYILVDVVLATATLIDELGGDIDQVIPELNSIEATLADIKTIDHLQEQVHRILVSALAYRDNRQDNSYTAIIRQAKEYLDQHYIDPDLTLNEVAAHVCLSASHFSLIFSQEAGQTFKEYLTETRLNKAKELLRMTNLRSAEISYQVGYNDPHYFSYVFRKNTDMSPTEYRSQTRGH